MARPGDSYYEGGKIYWRVPEPTTYYVDIRGKGGQVVWGSDQPTDTPKHKNSGLFGIFARLRTKPSDPGYEIAKRIIHSVGERELREVNQGIRQPDYGPQAIPTQIYHVVPQAFDPPSSGYRDEQGRWHDLNRGFWR